MEHLRSQVVNPHVERVIKNFQTSAMRSLQGPGPAGFLSPSDIEEYRKALKKLPEKGLEYDPLRGPPPFPVQQFPVFAPVDATKSEKTDTLLETETIACFEVGGEKRLCLPQILNTVLRDFSLQQINAVCDELHIFCSRCNPEQLHTLKMTGILPLGAPSCGLLTKTDAERLCNALLHRAPAKCSEPPTRDSFKVYHECFGKCKGIFSPEMYVEPIAKCIQCVDCMGSFSPSEFVRHSHKALENRTCHWGFDSSHWRSYLLLAKDQENRDRVKEVLQYMKSRFDTSKKYKRKQRPEICDPTELKRSKSEESGSSSGSSSSSWSESSGVRGLSAFTPWSSLALKDGKLLHNASSILRENFPGIPAYLQSGPPVLLNPDRVVPSSESSRYERGFAPNVSLAPASKHKDDVDDISDDEEDKEPVKTETERSRSPASREWDLPSESDDSLHLSDGEETTADSPDLKASLEEELQLVQCMLDKTSLSQEEKDNFLVKLGKVHSKRDEQFNQMVRMNSTLRKEVEGLKKTMKEKLDKMVEKNEKLTKQLERTRIETECRLEEANDDKDKLVKEIKRLKGHEEVETSKYVQINGELQTRLHQYELLYEQVRRDNMILQDELQRSGVMVTELLSKQRRFTLPNSPQVSPRKLSPNYEQVKKERDT
ncbi:ski oncogene-like [Mytilus galloprovincialis]|uniref:c-SKI SMAD4-binding domain-containing protein n=1 Tax=Mytilus galloprovincialis TaxID=29158 RepID=A0A8B6F0E4_MYTGA|nr:Hypothetical predicted protein [Mytilus galloprovincialis]